jgi:entry exclusion lipoprotein TrbK
LNFKVHAIIAIIAAAVLGVAAYRNLASAPQAPAASAGNCTPEAIRKVVAPVARAILSAQCNKQPAAKPPAQPARKPQ